MCEGKDGYPNFDVSRVDNCIYLKDFRNGILVETHLVPEQAYEIALELLKVVEVK